MFLSKGRKPKSKTAAPQQASTAWQRSGTPATGGGNTLGTHRAAAGQAAWQQGVKPNTAGRESMGTHRLPYDSSLGGGSAAYVYSSIGDLLNPEQPVSQAEPVQPEQQAEPVLPAVQGKYDTKDMGMGMREFDTLQIPAGLAPLPSTTFYADTASKRAPYARKFEGDKMVGLDGATVSTHDAAPHVVQGAKAQRHIYAMDAAGQFYTADATGENRARGAKAQQEGAASQERFHHSSFLAGQGVAGAGEMRIIDGQVELFNDNSGHYRPTSKEMVQTAQSLDEQGAGIERISAEFIGKNYGEKTIQTTGLEIAGYQGKDAANAEKEIRKAHAKKDAVMSSLLALPDGDDKWQKLQDDGEKRNKAFKKNQKSAYRKIADSKNGTQRLPEENGAQSREEESEQSDTESVSNAYAYTGGQYGVYRGSNGGSYESGGSGQYGVYKDGGAIQGSYVDAYQNGNPYKGSYDEVYKYGAADKDSNNNSYLYSDEVGKYYGSKNP